MNRLAKPGANGHAHGPDPNVRHAEQARRVEAACLGGMLRWGAVVGEVLPVVRVEDFYLDAHRKIFAALSWLYERGRPTTAESVADVLNDRGQVEDVGGYAYVGELCAGEPTGAHAAYYASLVRQHSTYRQLAQAGVEIARDAHDRADGPDALLEQAERAILGISQVGSQGQAVPILKAVHEAYDRIDQRSESGRPVSGVSTGLVDLDGKTAGLHNSELVVIGARTSQGKTAFGLFLAWHAAVRERVPVLLVSLEQARAELAERLLCCQGRVDSHKLRKGCLSADDRDRLTEAGRVVGESPLYVDDTPTQTTLRIAAGARRLKAKKGVGLVVIDYLQLVQPADAREPRQEQVAGISRRLKLLARELAVPVVVMAQVNRAAEEHGRPQLRHLRESGAVEQDSDTVLLLHAEPGDEGRVVVDVAKQRNGPTGEVPVTFLRQYQRFENHAGVTP